MRYHIGLGIGHTYSDQPMPSSGFAFTQDSTTEGDVHGTDRQWQETQELVDPNAEDPELGLENLQDDWVDVEEDGVNEGAEDDVDDEGLLLDMYDMYGA